MSIDPLVQKAIAGEIAARLRRVCEHWPDEVFDEVVNHLAEITIKYDRRLSSESSTYDRRSSENLVVELKAALARSRASRQD
jgi:hypothetical protein